MNLQSIPAKSYFLFTRDWMNKGEKQLGEPPFMLVYDRYERYTWYVQSMC